MTQKTLSSQKAASKFIQCAKDFEKSEIKRVRQNSKIAWRITCVCLLIMGLSIGAIAGLTPLKTVIPFVIRVDNNTGATDIPVSFNDDGSGSSSTFGEKLKPTVTFQATAQKRINSTYLLSKGTNIPCILDTEIITTHAGFTRCLVTKDVYSANGRVLLLERGSKLVGEQTSALVQGQARVFVLWNEVETPNGVKVNVASTGAGQLGSAGHGARVNYHFFQRFGGQC